MSLFHGKSRRRKVSNSSLVKSNDLKLFKLISSLLHKKENQDSSNREFEWCIVGNIVNKHYFGNERIIKHGSKHFGPNTKVYCFPEFFGIANANIRVLGKPRKQKRLIDVVIQTHLIKNFRVKKVYVPQVKEVIKNHSYYSQYRGQKDEVANLDKLAHELGKLTKEILE